ncbi:MAG TPA: DNA cytosine methyltransferase, partial [Armatimonadota bacterium]
GTRYDLPPKYQLDCHQGVKGASASYSRIVADEPAPTLTTRCTTPACGQFIHPTEHRAITLREAALLQTFPPSYRFIGTYGEIERQIGNAVPVRMACALGIIAKGML